MYFPILLSLLILKAAEAAATPPPAAPPTTATTNLQEPPFVGVNIGTAVSSLLSPSSLASFLSSQHITHVRLLDPDPSLLLALSVHPTPFRVALSVPNNQLLALSSSPSTASRWLSRLVLPFPSLVSLLLLGDDSPSSLHSPLLLPALRLLHSSLSSLNLSQSVKLSSPLPFSSILDPFPPSQAFFNLSLPNVLPLLQFLSTTRSPLLLTLYPYYVLTQYMDVVPLDNALFKPLPPSKEMVDPNTLLHYTNVLDAMLDAAYFSLRNLNLTDIDILVGETGWPSRSDPRAEPFATRDNAATYNSNLIKKVLVDRAGTPLRPDATPSVYIYELFDEDLRPGPVSEANWGLFHGNGTPVYLLHVSGAGGFLANDTTNRTFCVAAEDGAAADERTLQAALDWACGPGRADCGAVQPGEECYDPNNVRSHASYAFDSYYQKHGRAAGSCYFQGVAMVTTTDPSHGKCIFPGSKTPSNNTGADVISTKTSSADARRYSYLSRTRTNLCVRLLLTIVVLVLGGCGPWT